jgi:Kef-type K+ transport system membrane component KefB
MRLNEKTDADDENGESGVPDLNRGFPRLRPLLLYGTMLLTAIVLFLAIDAWGKKVVAPEAGAAAGQAAAALGGKPDALVHVLIALTAVLIAGQLLGWLFRYIGQPPVMGEVVAGILLGPSLLGEVWPEAAAFILPSSLAPSLAVVSQLGVILYMFLVGIELNLSALLRQARSVVAISHTGIIVPFVLGTALALILYPRLAPTGVGFTPFALFVGVALSITAFPVLARILTDRQMHRTPLGILALGCAAVGDVTAWCLLAFVVGVAQAKLGDALVTLGLSAAYVAFLFLVVRPLALRFLPRFEKIPLSRSLAALVFAALLLSALATEAIGIHALFGAFLLGAVIPHDSILAQTFISKLEDLVTVLLLPAFFAFTGMRTRIGLVSGMEQWLICGLIVLVATAGKVGATLLSARLSGLGWRNAAALGLLMNTRGLMELIVLNIGLDLNVISPQLFAMMVLMAVVTTMATAPLLQLLHLKHDEPLCRYPSSFPH